MQWRRHDGMVYSSVLPSILSMIISVKHLVVGWVRLVLASACTTLSISVEVVYVFICTT